MRASYSGITSAFQADDASPILAARSNAALVIVAAQMLGKHLVRVRLPRAAPEATTAVEKLSGSGTPVRVGCNADDPSILHRCYGGMPGSYPERSRFESVVKDQ